MQLLGTNEVYGDVFTRDRDCELLETTCKGANGKDALSCLVIGVLSSDRTRRDSIFIDSVMLKSVVNEAAKWGIVADGYVKAEVFNGGRP